MRLWGIGGQKSKQTYVNRVKIGHGSYEDQLFINTCAITTHTGSQSATKSTSLVAHRSILSNGQGASKQFLAAFIRYGHFKKFLNWYGC